MSLISLENKVGQFGVLGKCEYYKSEQSKNDQFDENVNQSDISGKFKSYKLEKDHFGEKVILSNIDEISEILQSFSDKTRKYTAIDLFSKFNKIGLNSPNEDIINSENQTNKRIKLLLIINSDKIRNFLIRFPHILFHNLYYPETVCVLRSGIEFFFQFCGDLVYENKKLFDRKECRIPIIDQSLKNWLKKLNYNNINIQNNYPKEHWWWQELTKLPTSNTNQPTLANQDLAC
jgi:hypothetical protein